MNHNSNITSTVLDQARFTNLWQSASIDHDESQCQLVFEELAELYTGADRHYHCDEHINQCLSKMDEATSESGHHASVEMAIWFHDVIYLAGDSKNEQNSAIWFKHRSDNHLKPESIAEVSELITATEHRQAPANDKEKLMVDLDLSSFSLPTERFLQDGRNIRLEFSNMPTETFINGQSKFLRDLLSRPSIYSTDYFLRHYEAHARDNIYTLLGYYDQGISP